MSFCNILPFLFLFVQKDLADDLKIVIVQSSFIKCRSWHVGMCDDEYWIFKWLSNILTSK